MGRLALTTAALVLAACGGSGAVGAHPETDAGIDATVLEAGATSMDGTAFVSDAPDDGTPGLGLDAGLPDVGPTVPCDAGDYFIVAGDDAGSQVLRGCATDPTPFLLRQTVCGEDYLCSDLHGCSDASVLDLRLLPYWGVASIGTYGTDIGSWTTGGSTQSSQGWVRIKTLPPDGGTVSGDYAVTLAEGGTLGGSFCVVWP